MALIGNLLIDIVSFVVFLGVIVSLVALWNAR